MRSKGLDEADRGILTLLGKGMPDFDICKALGITVQRIDEAIDHASRRVEQNPDDLPIRLLYETARCGRLENLLRGTQARFVALLETVISAVLVVDGRSGAIKQANSKALKMFGYRAEQFIGMSVEQLVPKQHRDIHPAYRSGFLRSIRKREMGYHPPIFALCADGSQIEIAIALTASHADDDVLVVCSEYAVWAGVNKLAEAEERPS